MKVTKYNHACLFLEKNGQFLVTDPGKFTALPADLKDIVGIIVTEEHIDHFDIDNIQKILEQSPQAQVYSTAAVCGQLSNQDIKTREVSGKKALRIGQFSVEFAEGDHAPSYKVSPCRVVTIIVDGELYYPSDSYIRPNKSVKVLALPTSGPWHKVEEAVDFANSVASEFILATHNGLYNQDGQNVTNHFISSNILDKNRQWVYLEVSESKEF